MVRSVDPDGTTSETEKKMKSISPTKHVPHEEAEEEAEEGDKVEEMTTPVPGTLEEEEIPSNSTGQKSHFTITVTQVIVRSLVEELL